MKRFLVWNVILILLAVAYAPALSAPPLKPEQAIWAKRVRLVWRTHNWAGYSKAKQLKAEKAVLANGKERARIELGRLLKELPLTDPLKFQVAYTMALLDLDYKTSRKVLLDYLSEMNLNSPRSRIINWNKFNEIDADPEGPEDAKRMDGSGMEGLIFDVYDKRRDPVLLSALLDFAPFTDGEGAEVMGLCLARIAKKHPTDLLRGLNTKSKEVWEIACAHIGAEIDNPPKKEFPKLVQIAEDRKNPLSVAAKRLIKGISEA